MYFLESALAFSFSKLICLVAEVLSSSDTTTDAAIQFYRDNLVSLNVVDIELVCWGRKWSEVADKSSSNQCLTLLENGTLFSFPT